ncbi:MAG TPA: TetR/AcrR family transcriptional regulator [Armatimonadota bacterium]
MSRKKPDIEERERTILDAAAELILRQGYDRTTLGDVAGEAGVSRGVVYLHYANKEALFEALLFREVRSYQSAWLRALETRADGGTIAGVFHAVIQAVNQTPFIAALLRQDRRVFGSYLRKPDNLFAAVQTDALWVELIEAMQAAGAIRKDISPRVFAHVMTSLALGLVLNEGTPHGSATPELEEILETTALMIDRTLAPEGAGNPEAGRSIIQRMARESEALFASFRKKSQLEA